MKTKISRFHDYGTFINLVADLADRLEVRPEWLLRIFQKESGFNPKALNPVSGATGLLQWLPSTAISLGTTTQKLLDGGTPYQLEYVEKYFRQFFRHGNAPKNAFDLYLYVFRPAWVGAPDSSRLPAGAYAGNKGLDKDGKGYVTKGDLRRFFGSDNAPATAGSLLLVALVLSLPLLFLR